MSGADGGGGGAQDDDGDEEDDDVERAAGTANRLRTRSRNWMEMGWENKQKRASGGGKYELNYSHQHFWGEVRLSRDLCMFKIPMVEGSKSQ